MKKFIALIGLFLSVNSFSQNGIWFQFQMDTRYFFSYAALDEEQQFISGEIPAFILSDTSMVEILGDSIGIESLSDLYDYQAIPQNIVWATNAGILKYGSIADLPITYQQIIDSLGYVPLESEEDPVFSSHASFGISSGMISSWNGKLNVSDTASMLTPYPTASEVAAGYYPLGNPSGYITISAVTGKLNISDTASMLTPYLESALAASTYATISGLNAKQNQLSGTGYVKLNGTSVSFDNSTFLTSEVDGSTTNEIELPSQTGNAGKHLVTNGSSVTWETVKRQETYSGTTNGSGVYTVTFGTAYSVAPNIQVQIIGGTSNQVATCTVSTTGFTVTVVQRNAVTLLATEVLLASASNVSGASVDVLITEK